MASTAAQHKGEIEGGDGTADDDGDEMTSTYGDGAAVCRAPAAAARVIGPRVGLGSLVVMTSTG